MRAHRSIRLIIAVLATAFFVTPLVLGLVGTKVRAFENRRLEPAPKLADGWNLFDVTTRYLIDRMPLRDQAVHANTWIDEHVFDTTPVYGENGLGGVQSDQALPFSGKPAQDAAALAGATPGTATTAGSVHTGKAPAVAPATATQVVAGTHGWFFLQGVLSRACAPFVPFTAAVQEWERLIDAIRASGRRVVLIVPADKSTIYPDYLPPSDPQLACGRAGADAMWQQIESPGATRAGIVGLRQRLLAAKRSSHVLLYYKTDSHWNSIGALTMTEAALPPFSSTVRVEPSEIVPGPNSPYTGDLLGLLGQTGSEIAPSLNIRRRADAPGIAAPTALIGDSYMDGALPQMQAYFASLTPMNWNESTPQQQAAAIIAAHDVILETVEREFDYRASSVGFVSPQTVALITSLVAAHPLR